MKKEYYRTIFRGPDMDTETVFKIIEMLDARIARCDRYFEERKNICKDIAEWRHAEGIKFALEEFRDHLQNGFIEPQVSQAENQLGE